MFYNVFRKPKNIQTKNNKNKTKKKEKEKKKNNQKKKTKKKTKTRNIWVRGGDLNSFRDIREQEYVWF
jgi:hypothetical protein